MVAPRDQVAVSDGKLNHITVPQRNNGFRPGSRGFHAWQLKPLAMHKGSSLSRVLFIRVPYYIGDTKTDLNLENYPQTVGNINEEPRSAILASFGHHLRCQTELLSLRLIRLV